MTSATARHTGQLQIAPVQSQQFPLAHPSTTGSNSNTGLLGKQTGSSPAATSTLATTPTPASTATTAPTATPLPTATPIPQPQPTATPKPKPPQPTPTPKPCAVNCNPWGYNFTCCHVIYAPPGNFCSYFACIKSFWQSTNGHVEECRDGDYSHSGGRSGSCSYHGGNWRPLLAP